MGASRVVRALWYMAVVSRRRAHRTGDGDGVVFVVALRLLARERLGDQQGEDDRGLGADLWGLRGVEGRADGTTMSTRRSTRERLAGQVRGGGPQPTFAR